LLFKCDDSRAIVLPGSEVPNWFSHQGIGCSISFELPPLSEGEIRGLVFCAVYGAADKGKRFRLRGGVLRLKISNKTGDVISDQQFGETYCLFPNNREDNHFIVKYVRYDKFLMERGEELKASFERDQFIEVKKCGIHFLFDDSNVRYGHESVVHSLSDSSS
jgi:hypothetical protein